LLRVLLRFARGLAGIQRELARIADSLEVLTRPTMGAGLKTFYRDDTPGASIHYTNDEEVAIGEAKRDAYFARTGIRLAEWELPPIEETRREGS